MFPRTMSSLVRRASTQFPVLLVTGPRQVGKTTLLKMSATARRKYVTLDDFNARRLAQEDPHLFVKTYKPPVTIDEIQYAPSLLSAIKIQVDMTQQKPGMYWLTGSQKFNLMHGVHESLAGRVAVLDLLGLSQREINGHKSSLPFLPTAQWLVKAGKTVPPSRNNLKNIYKKIWQGSFPKVVTMSSNHRNLYYRSYIKTYIQRDVRDMTGVSDELSFYHFITAVAARTGQLLNYSDLARDVAIDNKTAKSWLSVLQASGLVYLLYPWHSNINKRIIKTPKLYFLDTGLASYLCKWTDSQSLSVGAMSGSLLETWVMAELLKSYLHAGLEPYFYYYRDTDQREVDLLIETASQFYPVEIKKSATPSPGIIKHFPLLKKRGKTTGKGAVLCLTNTAFPLSKTVTAIPIHYL